LGEGGPLIASAAHTGLWRMAKTLLFVGILYDFTKKLRQQLMGLENKFTADFPYNRS
jgi:hypothetical protein